MSYAILSVKNLSVSVGSRSAIKDLNLEVFNNTVFYLLGPNGVGKTTLLRAVIGYPGYTISSGAIYFEGEDVTDKPMEYRVSKGLAIAHQIPPKLVGLRVADLLNMLCKKSGCAVSDVAKDMEITHLLHREFGKGFSGGELKRVEIATLLAQRPRLALVDEPDTGVDVDSIEIIARGLKKLVELSPHKSIVIVTHTAFIARYIEPDVTCILLNGSIARCGDSELLYKVLRYGFKSLA
ncbi:MAG: ATP-binding cassette domain-containing protein [Ignisphaera sp.]|jgi:Fe-S cluster assembly ATP-binding protein|nr:ATP-binding cassette domain-containing protein [Ignisphaera sp.]